MKKKELGKLEERIKELEETAAKLEIKNKILLDHLKEEQQTTKALLEEMNELLATETKLDVEKIKESALSKVEIAPSDLIAMEWLFKK